MDETMKRAQTAYENWRGHMISVAEAASEEHRRRPDISKVTDIPTRRWNDLPLHEQQAWASAILAVEAESKATFAGAIATTTLEQLEESMPEAVAEVRNLANELRSESAKQVVHTKDWPIEFKELLIEEAAALADLFDEMVNCMNAIGEGAKEFRRA